MPYGLLNAGNSTKRQAIAGLKQDANAEEQRNSANANIAAGEDASDKALMGTGASIGLMQGLGGASTVGTIGNTAAAASGLATGGTAATATAPAVASTVGTAGTAVAGAATMGVGLIAAWALTELL